MWWGPVSKTKQNKAKTEILCRELPMMFSNILKIRLNTEQVKQYWTENKYKETQPSSSFPVMAASIV